MTAAIQTRGLSKDYGGGRGLFELELDVEEGEVFGYLGPNGAGKSTTIRLLMDFARPSAGTAAIFGLDCQGEAVAVKRLVGYLPAELPEFGGLRGSEVVAHFAALRGGVEAASIKQLAERFDLDLGLRFRQFSTGNKRKLAILLAFMHRPRLLLLDEPSSGLDPLHQQQLFELIAEGVAAGATVFFSSHILSEVERVAGRVGILRHGRLVRIARLDELHEMRVRHVEVEFAGPAPAGVVAGLPGVEGEEAKGTSLKFTVRGSMEGVIDALAGHQVVELSSREPTLEELFLTYYRDAPPTTGKPAAP